ncbi:hypothetical protein HZZ13_07195 [Bradyrhizobium sp. CNPSo 4010]|uniref:Uncharacterized protein n=1 Tax=Bradyrhizobium agreste TaxID=2751811 RepID=A0ABS0PK50_9BRAD|nr:hypothetical protein [Bradyrhizobium agreste]MBH5397578.1 hypothetical protein [Bradyrhizobium agreste]
MASKHDVLGIRAGLKNRRLWKAVANANSVRADGAAKRHVVIRVNGDQTIGTINRFVLNEPAGS